MSKYLNKLSSKLKPSATLSVKSRASQLKRDGVSVIDLSAGEPDSDTPEHIKEAAIKALKDGKTKYVPVPGIPELREAIAAKFTSKNNIPTSPAETIVTNGGKSSLYLALRTCIEEGDEILVPTPYWVSYPAMIEIVGGKPVYIKTTTDTRYKITVKDLEKHITNKTKAILINSPSNPTGSAYTKDELHALGSYLLEKNILIFSDEVYEELVFDDFEQYSIASLFPNDLDNFITVNAFSKTWSMTGWRVGYTRAPEKIISAMSKYQGQLSSNVNSIAQYAAHAALTGPQDFYEELKKSFQKRMNLGDEIIKEINGVDLHFKPSGAFFLFPRIDELVKQSSKLQECENPSMLLAESLLDEKIATEGCLALVPGLPFGDDMSIRVSYSNSEENIREGLKRLKVVCEKLIDA